MIISPKKFKDENDKVLSEKDLVRVEWRGNRENDPDEPLIIEIEYLSPNFKKSEWINLKKLFIVSLISDYPTTTTPGFIPYVIYLNGVSACKYEGYGDLIIYKSADVSWDKLRPKIDEIIYRYLNKKENRKLTHR